MSFFSSLFGLDKSPSKAQVVRDIDVMDAINAHVRWKMRLDKYVNGTSEETLDPKVICRDDQCTLGKWIHGQAREFFHDDPGFVTLRDDHARFHQVASLVVIKVQSQDKAGAEIIMRGDYMAASRKVIADLTELGRQIHNIN